MGDCMEFPNTIKEFINQYSFKDEKEIYTNGSELIPVFRVMQAIEHYEKSNDIIEQIKEEIKVYFKSKVDEGIYDIDILTCNKDIQVMIDKIGGGIK